MKIPRFVWIGAGIAGGVYILTRLFKGSQPDISATNDQGSLVSPILGPGLYASWDKQLMLWRIFDGEAKAEQCRIRAKNASSYSVQIDGEHILVTPPDGRTHRLRRRRDPSKGSHRTF